MFANFSIRKDYKTYIYAALRVLDKRNDVTFLAIGDGINLEDVKRLVNPKYKERIKFFGVQNDIESIVSVFDIGVLMTNKETHGEGISNAIMEYMALSKPVIATNGGGTGEIVINEITGYLINPRVEELTEKIQTLLNNKKIANRMGREGKKILKNKF